MDDGGGGRGSRAPPAEHDPLPPHGAELPALSNTDWIDGLLEEALRIKAAQQGTAALDGAGRLGPKVLTPRGSPGTSARTEGTGASSTTASSRTNIAALAAGY